MHTPNTNNPFFFLISFTLGSSQGRRQKHGEDVVHPLEVSWKDMYNGMIQHMQYVCHECRDTGEVVNERDRCPQCKGKQDHPEKSAGALSCHHHGFTVPCLPSTSSCFHQHTYSLHCIIEMSTPSSLYTHRYLTLNSRAPSPSHTFTQPRFHFFSSCPPSTYAHSSHLHLLHHLTPSRPTSTFTQLTYTLIVKLREEFSLQWNEESTLIVKTSSRDGHLTLIAKWKVILMHGYG